MNIDHPTIRREGIRWMILLTLQNARPVMTDEKLVLMTLQAVFKDVTPHEIRRELDYLSDRQLVTLDKQPRGVWCAELTSLGVDVCEYTVDCQPGIARPEKYWTT